MSRHETSFTLAAEIWRPTAGIDLGRPGTRRHTGSPYFSMEAVREDGKSVPVPALTPVTPTGRRRYEEAQARRAALRAAFAK